SATSTSWSCRGSGPDPAAYRTALVAGNLVAAGGPAGPANHARGPGALRLRLPRGRKPADGHLRRLRRLRDPGPGQLRRIPPRQAAGPPGPRGRGERPADDRDGG